jgi:hypothetical protein
MSMLSPMLCIEIVRVLLALPALHRAGLIEGSESATKEKVINVFGMPWVSEMARKPLLEFTAPTAEEPAPDARTNGV